MSRLYVYALSCFHETFCATETVHSRSKSRLRLQSRPLSLHRSYSHSRLGQAIVLSNLTGSKEFCSAVVWKCSQKMSETYDHGWMNPMSLIQKHRLHTTGYLAGKWERINNAKEPRQMTSIGGVTDE